VIAINSIGASDISLAGSGSYVFVPNVPGAPVNLQPILSGISRTTASFSWSDGITGGSKILDYMISFD
jgi:hypothetical protein